MNKMITCKETKYSGTCFVLPIIVFHISILISFNNLKILLFIFSSMCTTSHLIIQAKFKNKIEKDYNYHYKVSLIALILGELFCIGSMLTYYGPTFLNPFGIYINLLTFFHFSEFFFTSIINPHSLSISSYLLSNGLNYYVAIFTSWGEYFFEAYYFNSFKSLSFISISGLILTIFGEFIRKLSMLTTGTNFNHVIQNSKKPDHKLIKIGIYSWFRHPAYLGWLLWAIGTQLVLLNPICFFAYLYVSWKFFEQRIISEEVFLLNFFGKEYMDYQKKVPTGIPFINGYLIENNHKNTNN